MPPPIHYTVGCCTAWLLLSLAVCTAAQPTDGQDKQAMSTYYLDADGHCQSGTQVSKVTDGTHKSGIIYSHKRYGSTGYSYPAGDDSNCIITLWVQPGYRIRLTALEFAVSGSAPACRHDSVHVFDHNTAFGKNGLSSRQPDHMLGKFCGVLPNNSRLVESSHNALTIWWHPAAGQHQQQRPTAFKLLWTAFRTTKSGGCNVYTEFACDDGDCIHKSLACDHLAHCQDKSDLWPENRHKMQCEDALWRYPWLRDGVLLAACALCVLGSVCCCVTLMICYRSWCSREPAYNKCSLAYVQTPKPPQNAPLYPTQPNTRPALDCGVESSNLLLQTTTTRGQQSDSRHLPCTTTLHQL